MGNALSVWVEIEVKLGRLEAQSSRHTARNQRVDLRAGKTEGTEGRGGKGLHGEGVATGTADMPNTRHTRVKNGRGAGQPGEGPTFRYNFSAWGFVSE